MINSPNNNNDNKDIFLYGSDAVKKSDDSSQNQVRKKMPPTKLIGIVLICVSLVLLIVIIAMLNSGYAIKNIVINGESPYSNEEINSVLNLYFEEKGKSYFTVSANGLEDFFYKRMPYLKSITVEKKAPDTIILYLEGEIAEAFIEYKNVYYLLNSEMKVLESLELPPIRPHLIRLDVGIPSEINVGSKIVLAKDSKMDSETYARIYSALVSSGVRGEVASLDARNKFDLNMTVRGGVDVKIGNVKDIEEKLSNLSKWLSENRDMINSKLNIDISVLKKIYISYDS